MPLILQQELRLIKYSCLDVIIIAWFFFFFS